MSILILLMYTDNTATDNTSFLNINCTIIWHFNRTPDDTDLNLKESVLLEWVVGGLLLFFFITSNTHKCHCSSISHQTKKEDKAQRGDWVLFGLGFQKNILKSVQVKTYGSCTIAENRLTQPISICGSYYMSEQPVNNGNSEWVSIVTFSIVVLI